MESAGLKSNKELVGIFIDHENINISIAKNSDKNPKLYDILYDIEAIAKRGGEEGRIVIGKVYAPRLNEGKSFKFHKNGIDPIYTPEYKNEKYSKSLADPMMICDIMETLYEREEISVYMILTNDKDFIPVIRKLSEHGKKVILMSVKGPSLSDDLVKECNDKSFPVEEIPVRFHTF